MARQQVAPDAHAVDAATVECAHRHHYAQDAFSSQHADTVNVICRQMRSTTIRTTFAGHVGTKERRRAQDKHATRR